MGTREIIAELDEVQPNGKMFKKYQLGDYRWISYEDLDSTSDYFGRGLRSLGLNPRDRICIFADTRAEWMISAQAAFKQCFPLCTIYTNLGEEAVAYGLNQTEVRNFCQILRENAFGTFLTPFLGHSCHHLSRIIA